jgi:hypothetical protein
MPHQHHFLSRLDRIAAPQVEMALDLYRDHKLLRFLLERARIPEGAPRVALSLDHPELGPFLIVTRDGTFVTCLAEGMTVGDLPIITREKLDGITAKHADLKARFEARRRLVGRLGSTGKLLARVYDAGEDLSREEFVALSDMQPLLWKDFSKLQIDTSTGLGEVREQLLYLLRRTDKLKGPALELLEAFYRSTWASAHLIVLVGLTWREVLEQVPPEVLPTMKTYFSASQFQHYVIGPAARGLWVVGKIGKLLLPNYKRAFAGATTPLTMIEAAFGLSVLGLRHTKLATEIRKMLGALPAGYGRDPSRSDIHGGVKGLMNLLDTAFEHPAAAMLLQRQAGSALVMARTATLPASSPFRFTRPEDVPEDLAMTLAVNANQRFMGDIAAAARLLFSLPWLAKAPPESLFAPADFLAAVRRPWSPKLAMPLLEGYLAHDRKQALEVRQEPSRNGPCPCGSGKKHKRCCAEERA